MKFGRFSDDLNQFGTRKRIQTRLLRMGQNCLGPARTRASQSMATLGSNAGRPGKGQRRPTALGWDNVECDLAVHALAGTLTRRARHRARRRGEAALQRGWAVGMTRSRTARRRSCTGGTVTPVGAGAGAGLGTRHVAGRRSGRRWRLSQARRRPRLGPATTAWARPCGDAARGARAGRRDAWGRAATSAPGTDDGNSDAVELLWRPARKLGNTGTGTAASALTGGGGDCSLVATAGEPSSCNGGVASATGLEALAELPTGQTGPRPLENCEGGLVYGL
jgi:hypothetical protein